MGQGRHSPDSRPGHGEDVAVSGDRPHTLSVRPWRSFWGRRGAARSRSTMPPTAGRATSPIPSTSELGARTTSPSSGYSAVHIPDYRSEHIGSGETHTSPSILAYCFVLLMFLFTGKCLSYFNFLYSLITLIRSKIVTIRKHLLCIFVSSRFFKEFRLCF